MIEIAAFLVVLALIRALRRCAPPRRIDVHVHVHLPPAGPGERRPADDVLLLDDPLPANVVPLQHARKDAA